MMNQNPVGNRDQNDLSDPGSTQDQTNQGTNSMHESMQGHAQNMKDTIPLTRTGTQPVVTDTTESPEVESRQAPAINQAKEPGTLGMKDIPNQWLSDEEVEEYRSRWNDIQVQFVDSPCSAVEQGDTLVAETLERVKQAMSDHQNSLNQQWLNHDDISTEELRLTLQNYRAFLDHILKI